jgi:hypothetical protein
MHASFYSHHVTKTFMKRYVGSSFFGGGHLTIPDPWIFKDSIPHAYNLIYLATTSDLSCSAEQHCMSPHFPLLADAAQLEPH